MASASGLTTLSMFAWFGEPGVPKNEAELALRLETSDVPIPVSGSVGRVVPAGAGGGEYVGSTKACENEPSWSNERKNMSVAGPWSAAITAPTVDRTCPPLAV